MQQPLSSAETDFADGLARHKAGQLAEAVGLYERALAADPRHYEARRLLGLATFQAGRPDDAERLLREAISAAPENAKAYDNLAVVLHAMQRDDEALPALRKAVELAPGNNAFLINLGNLFVEMGRRADAIDAFRRAATANPRDADIHQRLASELLKEGDAAGALRHVDACLGLGGVNSAVLALKGLALAAAADLDGYMSLMDFDRLIVTRDIGGAHGFPSLAAFNEALATYVSNNSTLHAEGTTVNGLDTAADLLASSEPCVAALRGFIYSEIEARLRTLPPAGHPFTDTAPKEWRTEFWGVKMWRQGHQVIHIHQKAWLSGVYYVQLPEIVRPGQKGNNGWIEFGRGPEDITPVTPPNVRLMQPVEGLLITFPSYVWHRTIPFEAKRDRISIAFDVIPVA